jgi:hypothetical protein
MQVAPLIIWNGREGSSAMVTCVSVTDDALLFVTVKVLGELVRLLPKSAEAGVKVTLGTTPVPVIVKVLVRFWPAVVPSLRE